MLTAENNAPEKPAGRKDILALWLGIIFSALFTAAIWLADSWLSDIILLPDQGAAWYYWKLPEPTFWTQATAWGFYVLHQVALWALIYYAQKNVRKYVGGLHPVNLVALGVNAFFIILHFIQTHIWYDGLAQNVPIWTSQGSVIVLLVWVLLMENKRRGMFFGKPLPLKQEIIRWARKYHGYIFSWAIVYTFWFHPTVSSLGHLIGFFYMFLLMLQGSLFFTRIHINPRWTFVQEATVLIHGSLVAVMQGNGLWPMFAFGFGGILVITQMHGLGLSRFWRGLILGVYIAAVALVYSQRPIFQLNEIIRIPLIEYLSVLLLAGFIALGLFIVRKLKKTAMITE